MLARELGKAGRVSLIAAEDIMVDIWAEELGKAAGVRGQAAQFPNYDYDETGLFPVVI